MRPFCMFGHVVGVGGRGCLLVHTASDSLPFSDAGCADPGPAGWLREVMHLLTVKGACWVLAGGVSHLLVMLAGGARPH